MNAGMQDNCSLFSAEQYREFLDHTPGLSNLAAFQAGRTEIGVCRGAAIIRLSRGDR